MINFCTFMNYVASGGPRGSGKKEKSRDLKAKRIIHNLDKLTLDGAVQLIDYYNNFSYNQARNINHENHEIGSLLFTLGGKNMEDTLDFLNRMAWFCLFVLIVLAVILVADYTGFIQ